MEKIQHDEMVAKLAKSGSDILEDLTPLDCHINHMTVGIIGEVGELIDALITPAGVGIDIENVVEELGDIEFYAEGLRQAFNWDRDYVLNNHVGHSYNDLASTMSPTHHICNTLAIQAADLLDVIKKGVIYRKGYDLHIIGMRLGNIEVLLELIREGVVVTREQTIQANIDKLAERYKGFQYSDKAAQERADKAGGE